MKQILNIFFKAEGTTPWLVLLSLILASLCEAVGISTLMPAANVILGNNQTATSGPSRILSDAFLSLGITPNLANFFLIIILLLLLKSAISFGTLSYAGLSGARVSVNLRRRLVKAIFETKWSFYADQSSGRFANTISSEATRAGEAYLFAAYVVASIIQLIAYGLIAVYIDWRIAVLGLVAGVIMVVTMKELIRISQKYGYKSVDQVSSLTVNMVDMLNNIKALKAMDRYGPMLMDLSHLLQRIKRSIVKIQLSRQGVAQGSDAITAVLTGVVAYIGHTYFKTTLPELIIIGVVFFQIVTNLNKLQKQVQLAVQYESSYVRALEIIAHTEAQKETHSGTRKPELDEGCKFINVTFAHAKTPVITNATFDIPANRITILQGPSGSGKTTLIDLFIGLNTAQEGKILIGKDNIEEIDIKAWRKSIGYVPQDLILFHNTIRENITLADPDIADQAVLSALEQAGAKEFIENLPDGIDTDVGEMGGKLSGGQRQRIALARALVTNPKILILDEVTSALDPETEAEIVSNIASLRGQYTIVAITHRPAWTEIADRLYTISKGHVSHAKSAFKRKAKKS